ncbi:Abi family protein [Allobaculum stercoricanis]|uniref:Abi family protein n=1 Tax=Allobaculum stercoricanis TaxID=174709 RepID=UPI0023F1FB79|nr:Abi family protein [Allobaculum stercoricanis]
MSRKEKLTIDSQIEHLMAEGVQFNIMSIEEATDFLMNKTYYFKLKSYIKNYRKSNNGKFSNLEFAYLVELSVLDAHFRSKVLDLCLSIEHQLKTMIMRSITENEQEDGFSIIQELFETDPQIKDDILRKTNSASFDLRSHYVDEIPVWVFLELCSYNSLIKLFSLYYEKVDSKVCKNLIPLIYSSKYLRNAAAHNSCLLNSLRIEYSYQGKPFRSSPKVVSTVRKLKVVSPKSIERILHNRVIHDFIASLILFKEICKSSKMYSNVMTDFEELFKIRFLEHSDYFSGDPLLTSKYAFVVKVFDSLKMMD